MKWITRGKHPAQKVIAIVHLFFQGGNLTSQQATARVMQKWPWFTPNAELTGIERILEKIQQNLDAGSALVVEPWKGT